MTASSTKDCKKTATSFKKTKDTLGGYTGKAIILHNDNNILINNSIHAFKSKMMACMMEPTNFVSIQFYLP